MFELIAQLGLKFTLEFFCLLLDWIPTEWCKPMAVPVVLFTGPWLKIFWHQRNYSCWNHSSWPQGHTNLKKYMFSRRYWCQSRTCVSQTFSNHWSAEEALLASCDFLVPQRQKGCGFWPLLDMFVSSCFTIVLINQIQENAIVRTQKVHIRDTLVSSRLAISGKHRPKR